jgi:hypothetical protein
LYEILGIARVGRKEQCQPEQFYGEAIEQCS